MSKISDKDKKDWQDFLSKNEKLPNKDIIKTNSLVFRSTEIDLHGFTLDDANKEIEKLIYECFNNGFNKIRVVTGKGLHSNNEQDPYVSKDLSILRYSVPEFIKNNIELMKLINEFKEAPVEDGGEGAFYILLKKKKII
ncbi:Smr/MutS family protein [Candidatus Pelagibacter sp.]|uniref:Smr/MutS family protein n=1 Tax=Candidatus Pelagibacter sp. TaxID=2024849 RepID=UPI003F842738